MRSGTAIVLRPSKANLINSYLFFIFSLGDVQERLERLNATRSDLDAAWREREAEIRALLELQVFSREADRIDALS